MGGQADQQGLTPSQSGQWVDAAAVDFKVGINIRAKQSNCMEILNL